MIKQYIYYKQDQMEQHINNSKITIAEKYAIKKEYEQWLKSKFKQGNIVVDKEMAKEITELIKSKQIPLVLDKYDRYVVGAQIIEEHEVNDFQSADDVIAVHKSPILPINNTILTQENSGLTNQIVFVDPSTGQQHSVPYVVGNDTIHFTLNCAVENHEVGNDWDSYPYAVATKLSNLDKTKILDTKSEDTYMEGNVDLGNEYDIFCPLGERENAEKSNPNATVLEYGGITLNEAIKAMLIYSGKKVEQYGTYGWERDSDILPETKDNKHLNDLIEKEGYPCLKTALGPLLHSETKHMARRMWKREYRAIIALTEYNKQNNICMPYEVMIMALQLGGAYSLPGTPIVTLEDYKKCVLPLLKEHGYEPDDSLFSGIDPNSKGPKHIIKYLDSNYGMIPVVNCPNWENELRSRVVGIIQSKEITQTTSDDIRDKKIPRKN